MLSLAFVVCFLLVGFLTYSLADFALLLVLLLTSYAAGSFLHFANDTRALFRLLLRLIGGMGILATGLLVLTSVGVSMPLREICVASTGIIFLRFRAVRMGVRHATRLWRLHEERGLAPLAAFMAAALALFIIASFAGNVGDGLAAHLRIMSQILQMGYNDFNVIEGVFFATQDLFLHMLGVWIMALGGGRGPYFIPVLFALLTIVCGWLILRRRIPGSALSAVLTALFFTTTPVILWVSTQVMQDIPPLPYLLLVVAFILTSSSHRVARNVPVLFFLMGLAIFAKKTAIYLVIPLVSWILVYCVLAFSRRKVSLVRGCINLLLGLTLLAIIVIPMAIVWHKTGNPMFPFANAIFKSPYFPPVDFADTRWHYPLRFNWQSLMTLVFKAQETVEIGNTAIGYWLLLFPLAILVGIVRRNSFVLLLSLFAVADYLIAVRVVCYSRYFLPGLILAQLIVAHTCGVLAARLCFRRWISVSIHLLIFAILAVLSVSAMKGSTWFVTDAWHAFKADPTITNHSSFRETAALIPGDNKRVLWISERVDVGVQLHHVYTTTWYNTWLIEQLQGDEAAIEEKLKQFDYVAMDINYKGPWTAMAAAAVKLPVAAILPDIVLYKPVRNYGIVLLDLVLPEGMSVTGSSPLTRSLPTLPDRAHLFIEAEPLEAGAQGLSRIKFSHPTTGQLITERLVSFNTIPGRHIYERDLSLEGLKAMQATWILCSHDLRPIRIYRAYLANYQGFLDKALSEYGHKR